MRSEDERLARHLRRLGRMYPVLAHDLLAFLNTMNLNLELLQRVAGKEEVDAATAARIRSLASLVQSEIPPLTLLLKAVVGQMRLADPPTARFDFRALIEEVALVFTSLARARHMSVRTTLADVPMFVAGDRDAMTHALTALFVGSLGTLPDRSSVALSLQTDRRQAIVVLAVERAESSEPGTPSREADLNYEDVRAVLERHGARVLETPGPGGSALEITLPLAPKSS